MYYSTKTYGHEVGLSCAFRQWRAEGSHCRYMHGYALSITVTFASETLDQRNWVVDFGGLKSFKLFLEGTFDHRTLVAQDDPHINVFRSLHKLGIIDMRVVNATGCEAFAKYIFEQATHWLSEKQRNGEIPKGVKVHKVEVREHGANSASYMDGGSNE